jgi:DNA-binding response OmpR family regulator
MPTQRIILIVEDEAGMRALLEDIPRLQGYQILTATTVPEAEAARQRVSPGGLALVIAKIHLIAAPEARGGCALAQRWRAQQPGPPFLLLSADPSTAELSDIRTGAVRWLAKPFSPGELLDAVRAILRR